MVDKFGRTIEYLRLSITDRCNLRCAYCMPEEGVTCVPHGQILRYEDLLTIAACAVELGIDTFKITGGEPLVRQDCVAFIRQLKALPGVRQVTLTTNGLLLPRFLEDLVDSGVDGVNISLDTLDSADFATITRSHHHPQEVVDAIRSCAQVRPTKVNAVVMHQTPAQLIALASLAKHAVDVRFIEQMPIGQTVPLGRHNKLLTHLRQAWPDLHSVDIKRGNGPARYYQSAHLVGYIGLIEAMEHSFCHQCNRIRLTSTGSLKPCLCYDDGVELAELVGDHDRLLHAMASAIATKPKGHCFNQEGRSAQEKSMGQIGG